MNGKNIEITKAEIDFIKGLEPFDLKMLLSEIHDHGWPMARKLIVIMAYALKRNAAGQA
jgi:hypothetical protein